MPTYEYECTNCNKIFDIFQKMTDKPLDKCPKCHKKISRLIGGGAGVIVKSSSSKTKSGSCPDPKAGCDNCPHAH